MSSQNTLWLDSLLRNLLLSHFLQVLNLPTESFKNFFISLQTWLGEKKKRKRKSTFWNWASVFFDNTKATVPTLSNATSCLLLQLILYSLHQSFLGMGGGEKTESERAKETSSSEPLMTRAKHVEGKSPNSGYSFSIPWRVAKLNISAG